MRWQDLMVTSHLLSGTPDPNTTPLPDSLRRAVSTAYYALFHALANSDDGHAGCPPPNQWSAAHSLIVALLRLPAFSNPLQTPYGVAAL